MGIRDSAIAVVVRARLPLPVLPDESWLVAPQAVGRVRLVYRLCVLAAMPGLRERWKSATEAREIDAD